MLWIQLGGQQPFCPLINIAHEAVVVSSSDQFFKFLMLITEVAFFLWFMHICQCAHILL